MMSLPQLQIRTRRNSNEDEEKKAELMLQKLQKCGFPKSRCYKALSSTGFIDEKVAAQWLVSHIDDPELDVDSPREFAVFLCPDGDFATAVQEYWQACQNEKEWNLAHEYPPHITLLKMFFVADQKVRDVHIAFLTALNAFTQLCTIPSQIDLNIFHSGPSGCAKGDNNFFIGCYVNDQISNLLETFTKMLLMELRKINIPVDEKSIRKKYLSLAYGFPMAYYNDLIALSNKYIDLKSDCRWEIRLYSRDARLKQDWQMFRMNVGSGEPAHPDSPGNQNVLSYRAYDHVALMGSCDPPRHGWGMGFNMNSGQEGYFPMTIAERVPQYYAWTVHKSLSFSNSVPSSPGSSNGEIYIPGVSCPGEVFSGCLNDTRLSRPNGSESKFRQLVVMRHGERVDFCFGKDWLNKCFDDKGVYKRINLNMPGFLPPRPRQDFAIDTPLTQIGLQVAFETGRALSETGMYFSHCFASPALRCVQTITEVLRGLGQLESPIRLEPNLFEWLGWHRINPIFMRPEQYRDAGFNVDAEYRPFSSMNDWDWNESIERYYERTYRITKKVLDATRKRGGHILIVGHAGSLDTCTRQLTGRSARKQQMELRNASAHVPYCGTVVVEERRGRWSYVDPPVPTFTHGDNPEFYWKDLLTCGVSNNSSSHQNNNYKSNKSSNG